MNEILLYLSLKYNGDWMAVYDSLQNKERITLDNIQDVKTKVNCTYTTLLDEKYPEGLKSIYKPPFGIFSYGNYELLLNRNNITVFGDINDANQEYLDEIKNNNANILWVNPTNRQIVEILNKNKTNNIFWLDQIHDKSNKLVQNLIKDEDVMANNLFFSEIWEDNNTIDYSQQVQERLYLGITHKALVLTKLSSKQLLLLASYATLEDIKIVFKKELFDEKTKKLFTKCNVSLIDDSKEIISNFFSK